MTDNDHGTTHAFSEAEEDLPLSREFEQQFAALQKIAQHMWGLRQTGMLDLAAGARAVLVRAALRIAAKPARSETEACLKIILLEGLVEGWAQTRQSSDDLNVMAMLVVAAAAEKRRHGLSATGQPLH